MEQLSITDLKYLQSLAEDKLNNLKSYDPSDTQEYYQTMLFKVMEEMDRRIIKLFPR